MKGHSNSLILLIVIIQLIDCTSFRTAFPQPTIHRRQLSIKKHGGGIFLKQHTRTRQQSLSSDAANGAFERQGRIKPDVGLESFSSKFCSLAPLWTLLAALLGIWKSPVVAPTLGSLPVMQNALSTLMLAMGLAIAPDDFANAARKPAIIALNALLCFGLMPVLAIGMAAILRYEPSQTAGIVLLGSVSGGQASNLFALLAGGDVALSVVCTLTTTLLGVLATPFLIKRLLRAVVAVDGPSVLRSVASLVFLPLLFGLGAGRIFPRIVRRTRPFCPLVGVLSTLLLVAGGAANSASSAGMDRVSIVGSCLLPILGGCLAFLVSYLKLPKKAGTMSERSRRTIVIETLSKSPTLAYVLARKHFGAAAASAPAAGMISLAVIGASAASLWSMAAPIYENE